jgi:hypothetical protein
MRDYDHTGWYTFIAAVGWANICARHSGRRYRVECAPGVEYTRFQVMPAKPPVVTA